MTEYDNTNRGAIWQNKDKTEDHHPDFKGSLNVRGVEYWVSAWKRKEGAKASAPSLSFSVKPKDDRPAKSADAPARSSREELQDDIPF